MLQGTCRHERCIYEARRWDIFECAVDSGGRQSSVRISFARYLLDVVAKWYRWSRIHALARLCYA